MRIDLACKHLKLHLLLLVHQLFLHDLGLIHRRLLLLDLLNHHLQVCKRLGKLVLAPEIRHNIIITVAGLVHFFPKQIHSCRKITRKDKYHHARKQNSSQHDQDTDTHDPVNIIVCMRIQRTYIDPRFRLVHIESRDIRYAALSVHRQIIGISKMRIVIININMHRLPIERTVRRIYDLSVVCTDDRGVFTVFHARTQIIVADLNDKHRVILIIDKRDPPQQAQIPVAVSIFIFSLQRHPKNTGPLRCQ